jgi:hypothetical protein
MKERFLDMINRYREHKCLDSLRELRVAYNAVIKAGMLYLVEVNEIAEAFNIAISEVVAHKENFGLPHTKES